MSTPVLGPFLNGISVVVVMTNRRTVVMAGIYACDAAYAGLVIGQVIGLVRLGLVIRSLTPSDHSVRYNTTG